MNTRRILLTAATLGALVLAASPAGAQVHVTYDRGGGARPVHDTRTIVTTTPDEYRRTESYFHRVADDADGIDDATADRYVASASRWLQDAADTIRVRGPVRDMRDALDRAESDLRAAEARIDEVRGDVARLGRRAAEAVADLQRTPRSLHSPWSERELIRVSDAVRAGDRAVALGNYGDAARLYDGALRDLDRVVATIEAERREQERIAQLERDYAVADARVSTILQRTRGISSHRTPVQASRQADRAIDLQRSAASRYARGDIEGAIRDLDEAWIAADAAWTLASSAQSPNYGTPASYHNDRYDDRGRYDDDCDRDDRGRWDRHSL